MKKLFFSFVMLVTLVIVAGSAKGQSTPKIPYQFSTENYSVTGITGTGHTFYVTTEGTAFDQISANKVAPTSAVITSGETASNQNYSNSTLTASINWKIAAKYRIWLTVTNAEGCLNYIYKDIEVKSQAVEYAVFALGQSVANAPSSAGNTISNECFQSGNNTYADNSTAFGTSKIYFKVVRTGTLADDWSFTPTLTGAHGAIVYGTTTTPATTWASGVMNATSGNNTIYIEVTVTNSTSDLSIVFNGNDTFKEGSSTAAQIDKTDDSATITIQGLPTIGTFSDL